MPADESDLLKAKISILESKNKSLEKEAYKATEELVKYKKAVRTKEDEYKKKIKTMETAQIFHSTKIDRNDHLDIQFTQNEPSNGYPEPRQDTPHTISAQRENMNRLLLEFLHSSNIPGLIFVRDNFYSEIYRIGYNEIIQVMDKYTSIIDDRPNINKTTLIELFLLFGDISEIFPRYIKQVVEVLTEFKDLHRLINRELTVNPFENNISIICYIINAVPVDTILQQNAPGGSSNTSSAVLMPLIKQLATYDPMLIEVFLIKISKTKIRNHKDILSKQVLEKIRMINKKHMILENYRE